MRVIVSCLVLSLAASPVSLAQPRDTESLRSPDVAVRRQSLEQIAQAGNPEAAGAVAALAADGDDAIQQLAIGTLLTLLLPERAAELRGDVRRIFESGLDPVRPVPASAYEPLTSAMGDANPEVSLSASYAFAVLASSKHGLVPDSAVSLATDKVKTMLVDPSADTRLAALAVAGRLFRAAPDGPPPSPSTLPEPILEALIASMNQVDPREQAAAMEALGRAREGRALDALNERLTYHKENGPPILAVAALDALARLADPSSVEMIRTLAVDRWAMSGEPYTSVLFARERLLHDGSTATLKLVLNDRRLGPRARAYLAELGANP